MNSRIGAAVLIGLAAIYLVASLALGRPASADVPPDLSLQAADAGIDVLRAAGATLEGATIVDVRSPRERAAYAIPGSVTRASSRNVIFIAANDAAAQKITGQARAADPKGAYFYLRSGVRDWYLTFELPVPLFNDQPPPHGYDDAVNAVKQYVATRDPALRDDARMALFRLVRMNYQPSALGASAAKTKSAGGARKKISGGCGG